MFHFFIESAFFLFFYCIKGEDAGFVNLSSNNIRALVPDICKLRTLVVLDLSKNGMRCAHPNDFSGLPRELSELPSLEALIISECTFTIIPPVVWLCANLTLLDIVSDIFICYTSYIR